MKEKKTNLLQVLARRALLVVLDGAIVAFSFYFALLLRADGAVEASWWPHNRALLYANLPWIVAVYLLSFLAGRLYTILWKYAGERDLIRLAGMIAVPTGIVYLVNRCFIHGVLFNSANAMAEPSGMAALPEPPAGRASARQHQQGPQPPRHDRGCGRGWCVGHQCLQDQHQLRPCHRGRG